MLISVQCKCIYIQRAETKASWLLEISSSVLFLLGPSSRRTRKESTSYDPLTWILTILHHAAPHRQFHTHAFLPFFACIHIQFNTGDTRIQSCLRAMQSPLSTCPCTHAVSSWLQKKKEKKKKKLKLIQLWLTSTILKKIYIFGHIKNLRISLEKNSESKISKTLLVPSFQIVYCRFDKSRFIIISVYYLHTHNKKYTDLEMPKRRLTIFKRKITLLWQKNIV